MDVAALKGIEGVRRIRLVCVGLSLLQVGCIIVQSLCLAWAITRLWQGEPMSEIGASVGGFLASYAARLVIAAIQDAASRSFAARASASLQRAYMQALASTGPQLVHRFGQGAAVLDATDGIDRIQTYLSDAVPKQVALIVMPLCIAFAVGCFDVLSGILTFLCLPFILVFMALIGHTASDDAAKRHASFAQMSNHFIDALRGLSTLRAFGRAKTYGRAVFVASERFRRHVMGTLRTATLSSTVLDIFATCGLAAVAIMLGFRMVEGSVLFFPALCVLLLVPEFFMPIRAYARGYHANLDGKSALASVEEAILFAQRQELLEVEYESIDNELDVSRAMEAPGVPVLTFHDVRIGYEGAAHVLSEVTFSTAGAQVVVVTGPSGAGKSSLLDVMGGFSDPTSGTIAVNGQVAQTLKRADWLRRVAYIPQSPHLFSATLRENVAFYRPEASDEDVYGALGAVGLAYLAEGPEGLELPLGEGGRGLSGGEAHRIALARCLADPRRDVVILDEPTAHLDMETEYDLRTTFSSLLSQRLVILATHRMHWVELADVHLVVEGGRVRLAEGGFSESCESGEEAVGIPGEVGESTQDDPCARSSQPSAPSSRMHAGEGEVASARSCSSPRPVPDAQRLGDGLLRHLLRQHTPLIALTLALSFIAACFACGLMFTSGYMISVAAALPLTVLALHLPSILVRIFGVGKPLIDYAERLAAHDWVLRATSVLRERLFDAARRGEEALRPMRTGEMLGTLSDDIKAVQDFFIRCALPCALSLLVVLGISVAAFVFSPLLGVVLATLLLLATFGCGLVGYLTDRRPSVAERSHKRDMHALLADDVLGLRDVILSGRGRERSHRLYQVRSTRERLRRRLDFHKRLRSLCCQLLVGIAIVVCLVWSAAAFAPSTSEVPIAGFAPTSATEALSMVAAQNEQPWPPNWIAAFAVCLFPVIEFLLPATEGLLDSYRLRRGAARVASLIGQGEERTPFPGVDSGKGRREESGLTDALPDGVALHATLDLVAYPEEARPVLEGIDLTIPKGSLVAVVGPSGAGKSTLMKVLAGHVPVTKGSVAINGRIGFIEQNPYIFNRSLRENLLLAKGDADDAQLECVLGAVGLTGLLQRLPKGLDTVLASGGEDVSGGEATRISVARALLAAFDIVILDEPFRALDPETEQAVMETIRRVFADRTVLIVTHHLQGIDAFDRVAFLDGGRIVMEGTPAELKEGNARFRALANLQ